MHIHLGLYGWWRFNGDETVVDEGHGVAHRIPNVPRGEWNGHSETRWGEGFGEAEGGGMGAAGAGRCRAPAPVQ